MRAQIGSVMSLLVDYVSGKLRLGSEKAAEYVESYVSLASSVVEMRMRDDIGNFDEVIRKGVITVDDVSVYQRNMWNLMDVDKYVSVMMLLEEALESPGSDYAKKAITKKIADLNDPAAHASDAIWDML